MTLNSRVSIITFINFDMIFFGRAYNYSFVAFESTNELVAEGLRGKALEQKTPERPPSPARSSVDSHE